MIRIMKTVIVFLFFALASTCNVDAQKPYVSMKECGNDTIKYIEANLRDNKDRYIGKPYGLFTNEFELGICIKKSFAWRQPQENQIWGIWVNYIGDDYFYYRDQRPFYDIFIEFERPYLKTLDEWFRECNYIGPRYGEYRHSFDDYIVKDIELRVGLEWWEDPKNRQWKGAKL